MYGSARVRAFYGAGDYNRRYAMAQGYYAAGGFFSSLKKFAGKAAGIVNKVAPLASLLPIPGASLMAKAAGTLTKWSPAAKAIGIAKGAAQTVDKFQRYAVEKRYGAGAAGPTWMNPLAAGAFASAKGFALSKSSALTAPSQAGVDIGMQPSHAPFNLGGPKKRKRRRGGTRRTTTHRRRRTSPRRRRRGSSYSRGDYGDNWSGNRPSRDQRGRYLTRAGGRRHRRRRHRGGGRRVSFTTKDGRRVSFMPRGRR